MFSFVLHCIKSFLEQQKSTKEQGGSREDILDVENWQKHFNLKIWIKRIIWKDYIDDIGFIVRKI